MSDNVKPFTSLVRSSSGHEVFLIQGKDKGRPAWHYVLVEDNVKALLIKKRGDGKSRLDASEYGKIIESGWGVEPPEEVKKRVMEQYGG